MRRSGEHRFPASSLQPGHTMKFTLACGARGVDCFVVNHDGGYYAYVNRCPHVGTPLDLWPNEFLADDGRTLICATHGALYEPHTGVCTAGPCVGDRLSALAVSREGDTVVVEWAAEREPIGGGPRR
jgi:nitrite reductase/ring-hydroxylating ferredoxin subunit